MLGGYQSLNLKGLNFVLNSITTVQMSITQDDKVQFTSTTNNITKG